MYEFIGANKPNYLIKLTGTDNFEMDLEMKKYGEDKSNLSDVVEYGNQHLFFYQTPSGGLEAHLYNDLKFMNGNFTPDEIVKIDTLLDDTGRNILPLAGYGYNQLATTKLDDGSILLFINEYASEKKVLLYEFTDLEDIKFKSVIANHYFTDSHTQNVALTSPFKTNSGNILIIVGILGNPNDFHHRCRVYTSKDKGKTWNNTVWFGSGYGTALVHHATDMFGLDGKIIFNYSFSADDSYYVIMDTDGKLIETVGPYDMYSLNWVSQFTNYNGKFLKYGGKLGNDNIIYEVKDVGTLKDLVNTDNMINIYEGKYINFNVFNSIKLDNKLLYKHNDISATFLGVLGERSTTINQDVIDIDIDKPRDMIGSATVQVNNYLGKYAPDGKVNPYMIWINKKIEIYLGYGNNLDKVFTGYIDSVTMESFPQTLEIQARDTLKLANDQVFHENGKYIHTYKDIKIVTFIYKLANFAGIKIGKIDDNDFRLKEYEINYDTVYDIMVEMADILAYELTVDNDGKLNFVSEQPKVDQQVVAEFESGKNITAINYRIDDSELYHTIIVQGSKEKEIKDKKGRKKKVKEVVTYKDYYVGRNNYNLPAGKILRIEETDISEMEKLKEIADRALYLMKVRARQVTFESIANSKLQVGDFIQVNEESTTISEVYRITGIGYQMGDSGYLMNIECYHHDRKV